jgi:pyruvate/2-oxoglutarate dehydrogenase complex dihydrolipoamide dehydrogenase (E3) component
MSEDYGWGSHDKELRNDWAVLR